MVETGLIVAVYVLFRAWEAIVSTRQGGHHASLGISDKVAIRLPAVLMMAVVAVLAVALVTRGW